MTKIEISFVDLMIMMVTWVNCGNGVQQLSQLRELGAEISDNFNVPNENVSNFYSVKVIKISNIQVDVKKLLRRKSGYLIDQIIKNLFNMGLLGESNRGRVCRSCEIVSCRNSNSTEVLKLDELKLYARVGNSIIRQYKNINDMLDKVNKLMNNNRKTKDDVKFYITL